MSEAPRIQLLSPRLANQIAAGEVVERPASVAKELLENSLDAGSRRIDVEVEQGGIKLLRVRDDGRGIPADDLPLALARHATSKIRELEDLERVMSLGFRGEALASISSVARLTMTSRTADAGEAWQVETEGRDMQPRVQPAAHPVGTSVEVRDLFFNTPARRKFLRAEKTEFDHLQEVIKRLALARFDVAFHLRHNGKTIFALHEARDELARARRVGAVCGQAFLEQALPIEVERNGLHLWGWVGLPTFSRSQPDLQYFYVNGRMVRDKLVAHAVRQAYRDVLYNGRHPTFVLFFEVDPAVVDVNVHPTKHEVRFRDSRMVHDFLYGTLHRALGEVRPDDQLAPPGATSLTEPRPTGAAAGEFGPQGEMRLAESVLESPAARVGWSGGSSASGGSSGYSAYTRPEAPPSLAEAGGAYKAYFAPLPAGEAPAALPESAQDITPWRSSRASTFSPRTPTAWCWWTCTRPTNGSPTSASRWRWPAKACVGSRCWCRSRSRSASARRIARKSIPAGSSAWASSCSAWGRKAWRSGRSLRCSSRRRRPSWCAMSSPTCWNTAPATVSRRT